MVTRRSWLFVPGHKQKMIDKAVGLKADVLIFDLEDGVPPTEVDRARKAVGTALGRSPAGPTRFVRTHGPKHRRLPWMDGWWICRWSSEPGEFFNGARRKAE